MSHLSRRSHLIHLPYLPHLSHAARCHPSWSVASAARDTRPSAAEKFCAQLRRSGHQLRLLLYHRRERPGGKTRGGLASLARALRGTPRRKILSGSEFRLRPRRRAPRCPSAVPSEGSATTARVQSHHPRVYRRRSCRAAETSAGIAPCPRELPPATRRRSRARSLARRRLGRDSTLPGDAHPRLLIGRVWMPTLRRRKRRIRRRGRAAGTAGSAVGRRQGVRLRVAAHWGGRERGGCGGGASLPAGVEVGCCWCCAFDRP